MSLVDYRFAIEIDARRLGAFTECSLPSLEWDVEQIAEGGLNHFVHQLPKTRKQVRVTLKRGLADGRELLEWYLPCLQGRFIRKDVTIHLFGYYRGQNRTVFSWTITRAFPTKWSGPQLQSSGKSVAVETLELAGSEVLVAYDDGFLRASDVNNRFRNEQQYQMGLNQRRGVVRRRR